MTKDPRLKGVEDARKNTPKNRRPKHDWSRPWNHRCLIPDCNTPVYYDGKIYWSLCLLHLRELELGPFFKRISNDEDYEQ